MKQHHFFQVDYIVTQKGSDYRRDIAHTNSHTFLSFAFMKCIFHITPFLTKI